jgi:hypothetical protein
MQPTILRRIEHGNATAAICSASPVSLSPPGWSPRSLPLPASLRPRGKRFALVGGLAVSVRAEVRFTRDVDLAVAVSSDAEAESLVHRDQDLEAKLASVLGR